VMEQYNKTFGYFPEPERVKAILLAAANTSGMEAEGFVSSGTPYRNNYYGSGRLDVYKSLQIINFTANNSITTQGQQKLLYINITNSNASIALVWGENSTTYNNLDLIVGNSTNNFTAGADKNDTVEHIFLRNVNNGTWNIYVNGTGVSGTQKYFIASDMKIFSDAYPPQWSANASNPSSPANYSKNGNYSFNITWTDDVAVDEVMFEWNFTTNYSHKLGNLFAYGNVFAANLTDLSAGNYSYKWFANDTSGKWNSALLWNYSAARASPNVTILLNSSAGNFTIASGDFVNITAASAGEGNVSLYNNSVLVNNTLPPIYNITNYIGSAGTIFNITAFYNQTQNFTSQTAASFIKIDNTSPVFSNNKTFPGSPAPYGSHQFNITVFDETNISSVILEWNFTANYTVSAFSGSVSYNTSKEFYQNISNISVGSHTYRWLANDSMDNWNYSQNFSYSVMQAASRSRLFLNGTEGSVTYAAGQIANISASVNLTGKNITIFANFSGAFQMIASAADSSENYTNTSNLNASTVYNVTSQFFGDGNYTESSATYYLGLCPVCPLSSDWSPCSGGSQARTAYSCDASTNYQCRPSGQAQPCSSGSSSIGSSGITVNALSANIEPIKIVSSAESTVVSIQSVQADLRQVISITNSSLPIKEISFLPSEPSTNARIEMRVVAAPVAQEPEGEVYRHLSIERTNLSFRNGTVIEFFIAKSWISDNNINVSTVALNRLSGNWTKLPTFRTGEDASRLFFNATAPGFSYFAITGEKIKAEPRQTETSRIADGEAEKVADEKANDRLQMPVSIGILLIIAVCFAVYVLKKGETKRRRKYGARRKK
jgi:PGF-pre-PGF domain-containing protein